MLHEILQAAREMPVTHHQLYGAAFLHDLTHLNIVPDRAPDGARILHLARLHRLTVYDAAYLELAGCLALPLATLDTALQRSAGEAGVTLLDN